MLKISTDLKSGIRSLGVLGLLFITACGSLGSSSQKQLKISLNEERLASSAILFAIVGRAANGSLEISQADGFISANEVSYSGNVPNEKSRFIVLLTYPEILKGHSPVFVLPNEEVPQGHVALDSAEIFYTPISGGEDLKELEAGDPNSAILQEFASSVYVKADSSLNSIIDLDKDGATADVDCNDSDSSIYPGAIEAFDGKDNNCNISIDEGLPPLISTESDLNPSFFKSSRIDDGVIVPLMDWLLCNDPENPDTNYCWNLSRSGEYSWRSKDTNVDHWVQFDFRGTAPVECVTVWWTYDDFAVGGVGWVYTSPKSLRIDYLPNDGSSSTYVTAIQVDNLLDNQQFTEVCFPSVETSSIRIVQPKGKGAVYSGSYLADTMYLSEIDYKLAW